MGARFVSHGFQGIYAENNSTISADPPALIGALAAPHFINNTVGVELRQGSSLLLDTVVAAGNTQDLHVDTAFTGVPPAFIPFMGAFAAFPADAAGAAASNVRVSTVIPPP